MPMINEIDKCPKADLDESVDLAFRHAKRDGDVPLMGHRQSPGNQSSIASSNDNAQMIFNDAFAQAKDQLEKCIVPNPTPRQAPKPSANVVFTLKDEPFDENDMCDISDLPKTPASAPKCTSFPREVFNLTCCLQIQNFNCFSKWQPLSYYVDKVIVITDIRPYKRNDAKGSHGYKIATYVDGSPVYMKTVGCIVVAMLDKVYSWMQNNGIKDLSSMPLAAVLRKKNKGNGALFFEPITDQMKVVNQGDARFAEVMEQVKQSS